MVHQSPTPSRRRARARRTLALVCTCAAVQLSGAAVAHGGSYTWTGSDGNWSVPGHWANSVAPTGNDPTDVLHFGGFGFIPYTSVNDFPSPFRLSGINIATSFEFGPARIQGGTLRFEGPQARISETGGGLSIENPIELTGPNFFVHMTGTGGMSGAISGTSAFSKTGPGYLSLGPNNTFAGPVAIGDGNIAITADAALGDPSNEVELNGGGLRIIGAFNSTRGFVINGAVGTITHSGGTPANPLRLTGNFSGAGSLVISASNPTNAIELTGASTRTGGTVLAGGRLVVRNDSTLGGPTAPLTLIGPSTLLPELVILESTTLDRPIILSSDARIVANGPIRISGGISGSGALVLVGPATLSGTNTYTGRFNCTDLSLAATNTLSPNAVLGGGAGSINVNLSGFDQTVPNLFSSGTIVLAGGARLTFGGDNGVGSFSGHIGGDGRLVKVGTGVLLANFTPASTGIITVGVGTLATLPDGLGAPTSPLVLDGGAYRVNAAAVGDPLTFTKPIHVESAGTVDTMNRNHVWSAPITGTGTLVKRGAATLRLSASGSFDGTLVNAQGTTLVNRTVSLPNADVDVQAATFGGAGSVGGRVTVRSGATLSPGDATGQPGILSVGQLTHVPGSDLRLQIAGRDNSVPALAEYDAVNVSAAATLDGTLRADNTGGFAPAWGDAFTVITWGARSGRFTAYEFTGAAANFTFAPTYGPGALTLTYARLGDANLDRRVNLSDFNALAANFGATAAEWSQADFNLDGAVNLTDFNLLAGNFGAVAAGPDVTPVDWAILAAAVPEPAAGVAVAATFSALLRRRRAGNAGRRQTVGKIIAGREG